MGQCDFSLGQPRLEEVSPENSSNTSKFDIAFDKALDAVCRIFQRQIDALKAEIDLIPMVNQQYCCSKRCFFDFSTITCCAILTAPIALACFMGGPFTLSNASVISTPIATGEVCAFGCCWAGHSERARIAKWEQDEEESLNSKVQAIKTQRKIIRSKECKQFCREHEFKDLTSLLQNTHFPTYMQTYLEIKRLEIVKSSFDRPNLDVGRKLNKLKLQLKALNINSW